MSVEESIKRIDELVKAGSNAIQSHTKRLTNTISKEISDLGMVHIDLVRKINERKKDLKDINDTIIEFESKKTEIDQLRSELSGKANRLREEEDNLIEINRSLETRSKILGAKEAELEIRLNKAK